MVAEECVTISSKLKYLGVLLDSTLSLNEHVMIKCKTATFNIRNIQMIRKYIDIDTAKLLATSLVLSHLDYSNNILAGLPNSTIYKLQRIQNWAAKVVLQQSKYDSSTSALMSLHWLPIKERIDFKILTLVFKCLHRMAPAYLCSLIKHKTYSRTTRASLQTGHTLDIPRVKKETFAARSFSVYGPRLWNSLPTHIQSLDQLSHFKKHLKTFLYKQAFY